MSTSPANSILRAPTGSELMSPQERQRPGEDHLPATDLDSGDSIQRFHDIPHRGSVDYVLRTVQQGLVHFSSMADAKANILITVCALLFSVGLTQFRRDELAVPVLVLLSSAAVSLLLAVLAILPWVSRGGPQRPAGDPGPFNPLFFMHVAAVDADEYVERMDRLFSQPPHLTEAIVRDIHGQSRALALKKFRLLRWSYGMLLLGIVCSVLLLVAQWLAA